MQSSSGSDDARPIRLSVRDIRKSFDGTEVLKGISFDALEGEVIGLVGENGAGKSTLLNILSGVLRPDSGTVCLDGAEVNPQTYREANTMGLFRVFQDPALLDNLTIYENLFFGWESLFRSRTGLLGRSRMIAAARKVIADLGYPHVDVRRTVGSISPGLRQALDIARVTELSQRLDIRHPVILFDEPTTALDKENEENFLRLLGRLRGNATIIFVSHRLEEILQTCDRIVVLKDGSQIREMPVAGVSQSTIHQLMVGRERAENYYLERRQVSAKVGAPVVLQAKGLSVPALLSDVSFEVRAGEVLGVAGTDGCGKSELAEVLAGIRKPAEGDVLVGDTPVGTGVHRALKAGIAFVPPDRASRGLIMNAAIQSNLQLPSMHDKFSQRGTGLVRRRAIRSSAKDVVKRMRIIARHGLNAPVRTLSGGNQQKVLIGKWLIRDPGVFVMHSPSQGIDTGAREAIYEVIRELCDEGRSVVLVSDDLPELIGLSDRILVMQRGAVVSEIEAPPERKPSEDEVVSHMMASRAKDGQEVLQ